MAEIKMLTISEAATNYGISQYAVRKWVNEGDLPAVRIGKKYLLNEQVVENFLKSGSNAKSAQNSNACEIKPIDVRSCN